MKYMEEMKIAGLAMALCIVMLGIYIVVPKDGTVSHLVAIPDNNAAEPVTDSTSQGSADADNGDEYFPIYTEDSYSSEPDDSYDNTADTGDSYASDDSGYVQDDNSYNDNTYNEQDGSDSAQDDNSGDDGSGDTYDDNSDSGSEEVIDDSSYDDNTSDSDLDTGNTDDTGSDDTVEVY